MKKNSMIILVALVMAWVGVGCGSDKEGDSSTVETSGLNLSADAKFLDADEHAIVASDRAAADNFGVAVAIDGDTLISGADLEDNVVANAGSAYIFVRDANNVWSQQAKLISDAPTSNDFFGGAVDISGDTVIVGASQDDDAGLSSGSAYIFVRNGTTWSQEAKLVASDAEAGDLFGFSVAIDGDTAVVGAHLEDSAINSGGAVYIFVRNGTTWSQQDKVTANDAGDSDSFGIAVDVSGDRLISGSHPHTVTVANQGAAYIFERSGVVWSQQTILTASDAANGDQFGRAVAINGNRVVVGAHLDDVGATVNAGSAYIFEYNGSNWLEEARITAADLQSNSEFGLSVALDQNYVVVGASRETSGAIAVGGAVYTFIPQLNPQLTPAWTIGLRTVASDISGNDGFGTAVAISGSSVAVGSPRHDFPGALNAGAAYVYDLFIKRLRCSTIFGGGC